MEYKVGDELYCIKEFKVFGLTVLFKEKSYYKISAVGEIFISVYYSGHNNFSYYTFSVDDIPRYFINKKELRNKKLKKILWGSEI